ncbi:MAG: hypothetical protein ACP5OE_08710, partial [Thermodesulfobium sp.]
MEIKTFAKDYFQELIKIINMIDLKEIEDFIQELEISYENNKHIFIMGNGGSGSTASHFACDMNKG